MTSALRLILSVSMLATAVGCDDAGTVDPPGPKPVGNGTGGVGGGVIPSTGGTGSTPLAGTGGMPPTTGGMPPTTGGTGGIATTGGTGGTATTGGAAAGVPLTPTDGWVDGMSNILGVQGAMFAFSDTTSGMGLVQDFLGPKACISGTAAKVDMKCTPVAPATDCFGTYWGAAIGLNLNQPIDPVTLMGAEVPLPFDATALTGFAFEITGTAIPTSMRFKVEDASGEFCTPATKPIKLGENQVLFTELIAQCWKPTTMSVKADTAKAGLVKIAWQVVTNAMSAIPFDYCVTNVRALQ